MEVERLRKKASTEKPIDDVEVVDNVEVVRPAPPPPPPPPRTVARARPRPVEAPTVAQPILDVIPVPPPPSPFVGRPAPTAAATVQATQRVAAIVSGARTGVLAGEVRAMLRSRQQVRAAMILHEILGPPLSRRRRGRA